MKLFGKKSVDDVLSSFNAMIEELTAIAERETTEAITKQKQAARLEEEARISNIEALRARSTVSNINDLIGK